MALRQGGNVTRVNRAHLPRTAPTAAMLQY
jgi:hypothetical protein